MSIMPVASRYVSPLLLLVVVMSGVSNGPSLYAQPSTRIKVDPNVKLERVRTTESEPANTPPSTQSAVAGSMEINSPNATLYLTDTNAQKDVAVRNLGGSLLLSSIQRNQINLIGRSIDTSFYQNHLMIRPDGNVGLGTENPAHRLSIAGGPVWTSNGWKGAVELDNASALAWKANAGGQRFGIGHTNGGLYFFRTDSDPGRNEAPARYDMSITDDGTVSIKVLEIEGADLAEKFEIGQGIGSRAADSGVAQGLVVSIDPDNPGKLLISNRPFDRRVAGVVSGAGGVGPGVLMGQGNRIGGKVPVALTGRVYCWADTSSGPIRPGDLLTTSSKPGHAMRVTNVSKAQGAILGKAMQGLDRGTGLVLILVTLQ